VCLQLRKLGGRNTDALPSTRLHTVAMAPPQMFIVRITFDADDPDTAEALSAAFRGDGPFLVRSPIAVKPQDGYVTVEFDRLSDDPTAGPTSTRDSTAGAEIVAALVGFSHQHSLATPVLRALLTVNAMFEKVGLAPRREMRIDVVPAEPLTQDSLSTHRSESVHPTPARFGG
jgi:hypothetical protein